MGNQVNGRDACEKLASSLADFNRMESKLFLESKTSGSKKEKRAKETRPPLSHNSSCSSIASSFSSPCSPCKSTAHSGRDSPLSAFGGAGSPKGATPRTLSARGKKIAVTAEDLSAQALERLDAGNMFVAMKVCYKYLDAVDMASAGPHSWVRAIAAMLNLYRAQVPLVTLAAGTVMHTAYDIVVNPNATPARKEGALDQFLEYFDSILRMHASALLETARRNDAEHMEPSDTCVCKTCMTELKRTVAAPMSPAKPKKFWWADDELLEFVNYRSQKVYASEEELKVPLHLLSWCMVKDLVDISVFQPYWEAMRSLTHLRVNVVSSHHDFEDVKRCNINIMGIVVRILNLLQNADAQSASRALAAAATGDPAKANSPDKKDDEICGSDSDEDIDDEKEHSVSLEIVSQAAAGPTLSLADTQFSRDLHMVVNMYRMCTITSDASSASFDSPASTPALAAAALTESGQGVAADGPPSSSTLSRQSSLSPKRMSSATVDAGEGISRSKPPELQRAKTSASSPEKTTSNWWGRVLRTESEAEQAERRALESGAVKSQQKTEAGAEAEAEADEEAAQPEEPERISSEARDSVPEFGRVRFSASQKPKRSKSEKYLNHSASFEQDRSAGSGDGASTPRESSADKSPRGRLMLLHQSFSSTGQLNDHGGSGNKGVSFSTSRTMLDRSDALSSASKAGSGGAKSSKSSRHRKNIYSMVSAPVGGFSLSASGVTIPKKRGFF